MAPFIEHGGAFSNSALGGSSMPATFGGAICRWDAAGGRQLTPAAAQDSAVEQILVTADGRRVFTTDQDGDLHIWDAAGGKSRRRIVGGIERGVVANPDGRFLAWALQGVYGGSRIRLYDVAAARFIDCFPVFGGTASVVAFLPNGKSLLTLGGGPATVRLWDVESGKERRPSSGPCGRWRSWNGSRRGRPAPACSN